ncbi:MAG TPA: ATP-binding protein [Bacteroidia bacterium]|nr:ATP-binding protein [Bacteroidia bacterium]HNR49901.1 ATP-binding protein [Bacteroidia bacterium]HNT83456.1 ATP-binding protein [Bacteroidia bacterium]
MNHFTKKKSEQSKKVIIPRGLETLIAEGEGEMLDYKKEITSVHKIAKTLASFSNHKGGKILVGVNDNKTISGIRSEEEKFMLQQAAENYCQPVVELKYKEWHCGKKSVLEVLVEEGAKKPYYAIDENGKRWVYIRIQDQTVLASKVWVDVLKKNNSENPLLIRYTSKEKELLQYLTTHQQITLKQYCSLLNISRWRAIRILSNLISVGVIRVTVGNNGEYYTLA